MITLLRLCPRIAKSDVNQFLGNWHTYIVKLPSKKSIAIYMPTEST